MSTNSRIGYLENGMVKSIYCHWDGYPSWNGVILHECYSDVLQVKELVDRLGYISSLGAKVCNTVFGGHPEWDNTMLESLADYKKDATDYHYLFDAEAGEWFVFYKGHEAKMADVVNDVALFKEWEPGGGPESFSHVQVLRERLRNGYQTWWEPSDSGGEYVESYYIPEENSLTVFCGFNNKKCFEFSCCSLKEAQDISESIYGKELAEIRKEFQPNIADVISNAEARSGEVVQGDDSCQKKAEHDVPPLI